MQVAGLGGVPANAGAVVMNVTVDQPTANGYVTVYPTGQPTPLASNLNFVAGQTIANLVTAKVGAGGSVNIYNFAGQTNVLFDVVGWFPDTSGSRRAGSAPPPPRVVSSCRWRRFASSTPAAASVPARPRWARADRSTCRSPESDRSRARAWPPW